MRGTIQVLTVIAVLGGLASASSAETGSRTREALLDKVRGAWVGKAYGVTLGGPTEFSHMGAIIEGPLELKEDSLEWIPAQDDMYVNMVFLEVVAETFLHPEKAGADPVERKNLNRGGGGCGSD